MSECLSKRPNAPRDPCDNDEINANSYKRVPAPDYAGMSQPDPSCAKEQWREELANSWQADIVRSSHDDRHFAEEHAIEKQRRGRNVKFKVTPEAGNKAPTRSAEIIRGPRTCQAQSKKDHQQEG